MDNLNIINKRISRIKEIKEKGGKIVGTFCNFVPVEILDAAGLHIINLNSSTDEYISYAESDLPTNLCPLIKSSYGAAISNNSYFSLADFIIGEMTCDGKKKMYELLSEVKDSHIMQLPQGAYRPYSPLMWENEVRLLIKVLEKRFNVEITEEKLRKAVSFRNKYRSLYGQLFELSKLDPPAISGYEAYKILERYKFSFDLDEEYKELEELINRIKKDYEEGKGPIKDKAKRILITGCPLGGVLDKIVSTIESNDGVVVCFENCDGVKPIRNNINVDSDDIVKAIADRYLKIGCSIMSPNISRIELLPKLIEEFKVDGVVEVLLQTCHPYTVEAREVKKLMHNLDIPYMAIETDYSDSNIGQVKTRIAAFMEIL